MEKPRDRVPFPFLDDLPLDPPQRATIECIVSEVFQTVHYWLNLRRQPFNRLAHRVIKVFQQLPVQPPAEGGTDIGAGQPKLDAVLLVGHRLLYTPY